MVRARQIVLAVICLSYAPIACAADDDPIKARLEKAKATYESQVAEFRKIVVEHFDKRAADARKETLESTQEVVSEKYRKAVADYFDNREDLARQKGDKKQVDQIKLERTSFQQDGVLPMTIPPAIKQLQIKLRKANQVDAQKDLQIQIQLERQRFEELGVVPGTIHATSWMMYTTAATKLETAYLQAIREYTKTKKDDEATAVERELAKFKEKSATFGKHEAYYTRSGTARIRALKDNGGDEISEKTVDLGLLWLAKQQNEPGFWEFDGASNKDHVAATGICLLPFLASGETPASGKHKLTVAKGLVWLKSQLKPNGQFGTSGMYSQAIATMALCEAAGMTRDEKIKLSARRAIDFIVKAQGANGSWGYTSGELGDTSIVGWQIQALKSARLAGIYFPDKTFGQAESFLESVSDTGSTYGYRNKGATHTLTAVGLLSRIYASNWSSGNPSLASGVEYMSKDFKPKKGDFNMYYYYYGTQVMYFFGGVTWSRDWNPLMRDLLIKMQINQETPGAKAGALGSWPKDNGYIGAACGKLGTTALAVLTLEVYYRHPRLSQATAKGKEPTEVESKKN